MEKRSNIWDSKNSEKIPMGPEARIPNIGARPCQVEFFVRYGLKKKSWPAWKTPNGVKSRPGSWVKVFINATKWNVHLTIIKTSVNQ